MDEPKRWAELAEMVRSRRDSLDLRQRDMADRGGPSYETIRLIEKGDPGSYSSRTLTRLDRALQWKPGTSQNILDGTAGNDPEAWVDPLSDVAVARMLRFHSQQHPGHRDPHTGATLRRAPAPDDDTAGAIVPSIAPVAMADGLRWLELLRKHYGADPEFEQVREVVTSFLVRIGNGEAVDSD